MGVEIRLRKPHVKLSLLSLRLSSYLYVEGHPNYRLDIRSHVGSKLLSEVVDVGLLLNICRTFFGKLGMMKIVRTTSF